MKPRILDLFCGGGGCTKGYQMAGFEVIGVDIKPNCGIISTTLKKEIIMPKIGDIIRANEVGFNSPKYVTWCACLDCGKERWVFLRNGKPQSKRCQPCAVKHHTSTYDYPQGENHPNWGGGRYTTSAGYIQLRLNPDHPFFSMTDKRGRVFEHRLVMAEALGRPLRPSEIVHHINEDKQDNRIKNLQIMTRGAHTKLTNNLSDTNIMKLQARIKKLEKELLEYRRRYGEL